MKILIVGGGGREHALAFRLRESGHQIVAAPGNPGIAGLGACVQVAVDDTDGIAAVAAAEQVDLVVIGPEQPLVTGLADHLRGRGHQVFGPSAMAAQLEGSKLFAKRFFARHGIRTAAFLECSNRAEIERAVAALGPSVVVKADGLAAGKGVVVCDSPAEAIEAGLALLEGRLGVAAGGRVLIEQRLHGREVSVLALCDGKRCEVLPPVEDHKAIFDHDRGPNTGGMGTVSPPSWSGAPGDPGADAAALLGRIEREIFEPTVRGLAADGIDYRGVLYAGLMIDDQGAPWMLEYNCRFGDPETQPLMVRMTSDLARWLLGAAGGRLPAEPLEFSLGAALCVVLAAEGYPGTARSGDIIRGLDDLPAGVRVFHAATHAVGTDVCTAGGRVLGVTAAGEDVASARRLAYDAVSRISFAGMQFRRDIGAREEK